MRETACSFSPLMYFGRVSVSKPVVGGKEERIKKRGKERRYILICERFLYFYYSFCVWFYFLGVD